jgi:hypothetical protein
LLKKWLTVEFIPELLPPPTVIGSELAKTLDYPVVALVKAV